MFLRIITVLALMIGTTAVGATKKLETKNTKKSSTEDEMQVDSRDLVEQHKSGDWLPRLKVDPHRFREDMALPKRSKAEMAEVDAEVI